MPSTFDPGRDAALRRLDDAADRFLIGRNIPGLVYGIVLGGELIHSRGIGTLRVDADAPPDADSVFRIASMTKSFTAATVLSLRDEGLLALDDPVALHIPDLADLRGPTTDSPAITVRHLLTMSAGFPTDDPWGDRQQALDLDRFAALLRAGPTLAWTPGLRFEYSNLGYGILGRVITNVSGREYREAVAERLLEPLGMTATTFELDSVPPERPYGALASMGGVYSSARDLARWVSGFADAFPPRDDPDDAHPLRRSTRREMQQVHRAIPASLAAASPDAPLDQEADGYGMGLFVIDDVRFGRIVGHSGGYPGFGSNMRWHPASGIGVVALMNHRYAPATAMARELLRVALDPSAPLVAPRRLAPSPPTRAARLAVEGLLADWDDAAADRLFAMNVDLDEPLSRRHAAIERLKAVHGALAADLDEPEVALSSGDLEWWMRGERGRVKVGILLSPEPEPRVQDLRLTSVPEPSHDLVAIAARIAAMLVTSDAADLGSLDLRMSSALDPVAIDRSLRAAAARFAPLRLGSTIAGSETGATWRLIGDRGDLTLHLERDAATGDLTALDIKTVALEPPPYAD